MEGASPQPEDYARALLVRFRHNFPLKLDKLTNEIGLRIREVEARGFEGALVRVPGAARGIIAVRSDIKELGRKRFTIAHEIGHYILPGHGEVMPVCTSGDVEWHQNLWSQESAANRFAAELLMPTTGIEYAIERYKISLETAQIISGAYKTSLTAAVMKLVDVASEPCAFVVTAGGVVLQFRPNSNFKYQVTIGRTVGSDTKAFHLSEEGDNSTDNGLVAAVAWLNFSPSIAGKSVQEDSILLPYYDKTLTILTFPMQEL